MYQHNRIDITGYPPPLWAVAINSHGGGKPGLRNGRRGVRESTPDRDSRGHQGVPEQATLPAGRRLKVRNDLELEISGANQVRGGVRL